MDVRRDGWVGWLDEVGLYPQIESFGWNFVMGLSFVGVGVLIGSLDWL